MLLCLCYKAICFSPTAKLTVHAESAFSPGTDTLHFLLFFLIVKVTQIPALKWRAELMV